MRLGGITEVASELGVSRQRVAKLREAPGFPEPVGEIAAGTIWDLDQVATWNDSGLRRSTGRPAAAERSVILADRYRLEKPAIGSGGFADVYRAVDLKAREGDQRGVVAIKVLRDKGDSDIQKRFLRELRIIRGLSHPNVVAVLDDGSDDQGRLWFAMPLAQGSLADEVDTFAGRDDAILQVMRNICAGLSYVHTDAGIFHRDLKPANVLKVGSGEWALSDFGLAREAERLTTAVTTTTQGLGTVIYSPPESWVAARDCTAPSDIFSLGKILHELVTGMVPMGDPPAGKFKTIIAKATRQEPVQRYQTVDEFLSALENIITAPAGRWETTEDVVERLKGRLRVEVPDPAALEELQSRVNAADNPGDVVFALRGVIPRLSRHSIAWLWAHDPDQFRSMVEIYAQHVARHDRINFDWCDVIADFFDRAVLVTEDDDVIRCSVAALLPLGKNHNRWHVQDVAVALLQRIRLNTSAAAAMDGVREAGLPATAWTLSDFVVRSLHPILRDGIEAMKAG